MKQRFLAMAVVVVGMGLSASLQAAERAYAVLFQGQPSGALTVEAQGRTLQVDFTYRDNGRGPDYREHIELDALGGLLRYRIDGKSTFGAPVSEQFERGGAQLQWRSQVDAGSVEHQGAVGYLPVESSPALIVLLAQQAAMQPQGRLPLLPAGELRVERMTAQTVAGHRLALWALHGLDMAPVYLWLTDDAARDFAALVAPGYFAVVGDALRAHVDTLEAAQLQVEDQWLDALAQQLPQRVADPLLIRNVRVFDAPAARLGPLQDVYIFHGRISALREAGAPVREPATVIDGGGRTLLPGLIDMHTHQDAQSAPLHLAAGVTTIRDMGNDNPTLDELIRGIESGERVGPRIVAAGFIEGESAFSSRGGFVVSSLEQAQAAADWYAQRGYRQIKLYNSIQPQWVAPLTAYAHARGLRVAGHVPAFMRAAQAVDAGYDELTHINQVMLNFLMRDGDDTRDLTRFYRIMEDAHALDLDRPDVVAFIAELARRGTVVDPTLAVFEDMYQRQGQMHPSFASVASHLPATMARSLLKSSFDVTADNAERYRASFDVMGEFVRRLHQAGVPLVAGTDSVPGFTLHRELQLYVHYGIPAGEALRIATWNAARDLGLEHRIGSISPGMDADLLLVDGNPLDDIQVLQRAVLTVKGGVLYAPEQIYRALGVTPFVPSLPIVALPAATESAPSRGGGHRH